MRAIPPSRSLLLSPTTGTGPQNGRTGPGESLSRREFLAGAAAAGVSLFLQPSRPSAPRETASSWAWLADTHISRNPDESVRGTNMAGNLRRVVESLLAEQPDRALFNGDIAFEKGLPEDYEAFLKIIEPLKTNGIPMHFTPGNHDQRENFSSALEPTVASPLDGKRVAVLDDDGVHWVFLDSLDRVNAFSGRLGPAQLDWLTRELDAHSDCATIVCLHHHPEATAIGLKDADSFVDVVKARSQVKAVVFGHTHRYRRWTLEGLHFINLPAVGFWFSPTVPLGWLRARVRPGTLELQMHTLKADTIIKQDVEHLPLR